MKEYLYTTRVYFSDTDAAGLVYHASYIDWAEHGRTEMLKELVPDKTQAELAAGADGILILVRSIKIDYQKPSYLDDIITVHTTIEEFRRLSCIFRQVVMRGDEVLADLHVSLAFVNAETKRPALIPDFIRNAFSE